MPRIKADICDEVLLWPIPIVQQQLGGVHRTTVDRLVNQGKLVRVKIGERSLITRQSVIALIEANRVAAE
jgi:excisionase family DNA binding protein